MSLTIRPFRVLDTKLSAGKMSYSGIRHLNDLEKIVSNREMVLSLVNKVAVPGMPYEISVFGQLYGKAHLCQSMIKIIQSYQRPSGVTEEVYIPERQLRMTKIGGICLKRNTIIYAFSERADPSPVSLIWTVLFASTKRQSNGEYVDINLPDYPEVYLSIMLIPDGWTHRRVINEEKKLCVIPGDLKYYCLNPMLSSGDIGISHAIVMQAYNKIDGFPTRVIVTWEDLNSSDPKVDFDYNDVILSISSSYFDELMVNDTDLK